MENIKKARWYRIVLMLFIMYLFAFIDRNNISMAAPSMVKELNMSPTVTGVLLSAFFWGYVINQIPGGWFASKISAKKVIVTGMVLWAIASMLTGLVHSYNVLLVIRFLLGFTEGVIWPSMLVILVHWFPDTERAKAINVVQSTGVVAPILMSPIAGWMIAKWNYHTMFFLQAAPVILLAAVFAFLIYDTPEKDPMLSQGEREYLLKNKSTNAEDTGSFLEVITKPRMWLFALIFFFWITSMYGVGLWLPSAIKQFTSQGIEAVGWLSAVPYVVAFIFMYLNSWWSDKRNGNRVINITLSVLVAGLSLLIEHFIPKGHVYLNMFLLSLTVAGIYSGLGPWWAWIIAFMPRNQSGPSIGFINLIGNLGGIFGPIVVGWAATNGDLSSGFYVLGFGLIIDFILICLFAYLNRNIGQKSDLSNVSDASI